MKPKPRTENRVPQTRAPPNLTLKRRSFHRLWKAPSLSSRIVQSLRWPGFPQKLQTCVVFFRSLFYSSGVFFPEALASGLVRGWDLKPVFLVVLGRFFPFFGGRFVLYLVRLKPFVQFVSLVFPSIRTCGRNQRFRCFCGSVGQRNPRSRSPFPFFFLPFLHFCPLRVHIRSVSPCVTRSAPYSSEHQWLILKSATPKLHCARIGVDFITMVWIICFIHSALSCLAENADCFLQRSFRGESSSVPRDMLLFLRSTAPFFWQIIIGFAFWTFLVPVV